MIFDPIALWPAVFGIGGMLVGGFITYHLVQKELVKLSADLTGMSNENKGDHRGFVTKETFWEKCRIQEDRVDKLDDKFEKVFDKLDELKDLVSKKVDR